MTKIEIKRTPNFIHMWKKMINWKKGNFPTKPNTPFVISDIHDRIIIINKKKKPIRLTSYFFRIQSTPFLRVDLGDVGTHLNWQSRD